MLKQYSIACDSSNVPLEVIQEPRGKIPEVRIPYPISCRNKKAK